METSGSTKLFILKLGYIENDIALNHLLHNQATIDDKNRAAEWHRVPSFCLLVIHPTLGNVLIDTGSHPEAMNGYWPEETRRSIPLIREEEDFLDKRLEELGLTPNDIDMLILSHLHLDHAGGLFHFSGTEAGKKVVAHTEEIKQALYDTFPDKKGVVNGYFLPDFNQLAGIGFDPVYDSTPLADDLEIIFLPGHSAGTIGVLIHLENSGSIFYTSDAVNWGENIYPETHLSAVFHDSVKMKKSINKIRWIQRRYDAKLIYGHDLNQFNELTLSPKFYN